MKNSMGKILIYSYKKDLLSKSSKIPIPKTFPMSVAWNIWGISPLGATLMFIALF